MGYCQVTFPAGTSELYSLYKVSISNPTTGRDFVGYRSEGVMPEVNEFRRLKVLLEEIQDLQVLKCTRTSLDN